MADGAHRLNVLVMLSGVAEVVVVFVPPLALNPDVAAVGTGETVGCPPSRAATNFLPRTRGLRT